MSNKFRYDLAPKSQKEIDKEMQKVRNIKPYTNIGRGTPTPPTSQPKYWDKNVKYARGDMDKLVRDTFNYDYVRSNVETGVDMGVYTPEIMNEINQFGYDDERHNPFKILEKIKAGKPTSKSPEGDIYGKDEFEISKDPNIQFWSDFQSRRGKRFDGTYANITKPLISPEMMKKGSKWSPDNKYIDGKGKYDYDWANKDLERSIGAYEKAGIGGTKKEPRKVSKLGAFISSVDNILGQRGNPQRFDMSGATTQKDLSDYSPNPTVSHDLNSAFSKSFIQRWDENINVPKDKQKHRGAFGRVFDLVGTPGYAVTNVLDNITNPDYKKGVGSAFGEGIADAMSSTNPFRNAIPEDNNRTFSKTLDNFGWERQDYVNSKQVTSVKPMKFKSVDVIGGVPQLVDQEFGATLGDPTEQDFENAKVFGHNVIRGITAFAGDIISDPLSWLNMGVLGTGKQVAKGTGTKVGSEVVEQATKSSVLLDLQKMGKTASPEKLEQIVKLTNQNRGIAQTRDLTVGLSNVPFFNKFSKKPATTLIKGDTLASIGDATIAPAVNKGITGVKKSWIGKIFDRSGHRLNTAYKSLFDGRDQPLKEAYSDITQQENLFDSLQRNTRLEYETQMLKDGLSESDIDEVFDYVFNPQKMKDHNQNVTKKFRDLYKPDKVHNDMLSVFDKAKDSSYKDFLGGREVTIQDEMLESLDKAHEHFVQPVPASIHGTAKVKPRKTFKSTTGKQLGMDLSSLMKNPTKKIDTSKIPTPTEPPKVFGDNFSKTTATVDLNNAVKEMTGKRLSKAQEGWLENILGKVNDNYRLNDKEASIYNSFSKSGLLPELDPLQTQKGYMDSLKKPVKSSDSKAKQFAQKIQNAKLDKLKDDPFAIYTPEVALERVSMFDGLSKENSEVMLQMPKQIKTQFVNNLLTGDNDISVIDASVYDGVLDDIIRSVTLDSKGKMQKSDLFSTIIKDRPQMLDGTTDIYNTMAKKYGYDVFSDYEEQYEKLVRYNKKQEMGEGVSWFTDDGEAIMRDNIQERRKVLQDMKGMTRKERLELARDFEGHALGLDELENIEYFDSDLRLGEELLHNMRDSSHKDTEGLRRTFESGGNVVGDYEFSTFADWKAYKLDGIPLSDFKKRDSGKFVSVMNKKDNGYNHISGETHKLYKDISNRLDKGEPVTHVEKKLRDMLNSKGFRPTLKQPDLTVVDKGTDFYNSIKRIGDQKRLPETLTEYTAYGKRLTQEEKFARDTITKNINGKSVSIFDVQVEDSLANLAQLGMSYKEPKETLGTLEGIFNVRSFKQADFPAPDKLKGQLDFNSLTRYADQYDRLKEFEKYNKNIPGKESNLEVAKKLSEILEETHSLKSGADAHDPFLKRLDQTWDEIFPPDTAKYLKKDGSIPGMNLHKDVIEKFATDEGKAWFNGMFERDKKRSAEMERLFDFDKTSSHGTQIRRTVSEINELAEGSLGFKLFDTDLEGAFLKSAVRDNKAIYDSKTVNEFVTLFGKRIPTDVSNYSHAIGKGETLVVNGKNFAELFGPATKDVAKELGIKSLYESGYTPPLMEVKPKHLEKLREMRNIDNLGVYTMEKVVLDDVVVKGYAQYNKDRSTFTKLWDKVTSLYKGQAVGTPGFQMRNAVSNNMQNYMSVGEEVLKPQNHIDATKILRKNKGSMMIGDKKYTYEELNNLASSYGILETGFFDDVGKSSMGEWAKEAKTKGLQNINPLSKDFAPYTFGSSIGTTVESSDKLLNFIANMKLGKSPRESAEAVNKYLFDYGDLSNVERNFIRRVVPFYTFTKKNVGLQLDNVINNPSKVGVFGKAHANILGSKDPDKKMDNTLRPNFAEDYTELPFQRTNAEGRKEDVLYKSMSPIDGLGMLTALGNKKDMKEEYGGMLHPLIQLPIEHALNENIFFGDKIKKYDEHESEYPELLQKAFPDLEGKTMSPYKAHALNKIPAYKRWNDFYKHKEKEDKEDLNYWLMKYALGLQIYRHDEDDAKNRALKSKYHEYRNKFNAQ